jgi:hypothetical protein
MLKGDIFRQGEILRRKLGIKEVFQMGAISGRLRLLLLPLTSAALLLLIAVVLAAGCGGGLAIDQVKLKAGDLNGWTLNKEIEVTTGNAAPGSIVKELFAAGAVRIRDQYLRKDGKALQVNFVEMKDSKGATQAAAMLKKAVGSVNTIGVKQNVAVEVIGQPEDKELVVKQLKLTD